MEAGIKMNNDNVIFTFLQDTKDGKYVEVDKNIIDIPRISTSRNEYLLEEEMPLFFSVKNHL